MRRRHAIRCHAVRRLAAGAIGLVLFGLPTACASSTDSAPRPGGKAVALHVIASFYPLQYIVERIGGPRVSVVNLTPVGAEPHELELTARNTADLEDADLVVYLSGFAPAVDDAVSTVAGKHALDVGVAARLDHSYTPIEDGEQADSTRRDPHFWLDPTRLAAVAAAVTERLATDDPADAATFRANLTGLDADLDTLDHEFAAGLAHCTNTTIVTSHNAFGYLAERYGLTQIGITGLTPEDEPTPGDLARVTQFVEDHHVGTIYYENLVSPAIARTVADETGAKTAVLDPIEGLPDSSGSADYLTIMRADLATLRVGQGCS